MQAYDLIFKKSHQVRETILAENGDAAEDRARDLVSEFISDSDEDGAALEFLWLEKAGANYPFVLGGKTYLTDSETREILRRLFPSSDPALSSEMKLMSFLVRGQRMSRIVEACIATES